MKEKPEVEYWNQQTESAVPGGTGRWSAKRELDVILELLRGADIEVLSRKYRVNLATLSECRERFLAGGESGLKSRKAEPDNEGERRLKSVVVNLSGERIAPRRDLTLGTRSPFCVVEVEKVSSRRSPSTRKKYGISRVLAVWQVPRSSFYAARRRLRQQQTQQSEPSVAQSVEPTPAAAAPASGRLTDVEALAAIRKILTEPDFSAEGYRKVWARLRHTGVRVWKDRVLRLMRENQLLSPDRRLQQARSTPMAAPLFRGLRIKSAHGRNDRLQSAAAT